MPKSEFFRISSGLKNLIGSELITDNYVAVFELVKNSFDARATEVRIVFKDIYTKNAKIIIIDNGKGMDHNDLINKWLFVAYSAKKDGTEDESDYRNELSSPRVYAGAKGVGRFSCDRLGRHLNLISIKDKKDAKIENLLIDWNDFEHDQEQEFIRIPVEHNVLKSIEYEIDHGTILEISGIDNDEWNRDNFIRLKDRLSKLIRPDLHESIQDREFKIIIEVDAEEESDKNEIKKAKDQNKDEGYIYRNTVNGEVKNFVFDDLDIRTTKIESKVSVDGKFIETELNDRDLFIYRIREINKYNLLANVSITLYFLNRSAKSIFKRRMGVAAIDYGSIFVYKNGFRIYPFGERGDDSLGIDNRAVQGYSRYIGLRNLIGQINITGDASELRETTSRDGGLVKTKAYQQMANLSDGLLVNTLRRLEKYVVDVTQWGINDDSYEVGESDEGKEELVKLISNIVDDKLITSIEYNDEIVDILNQKEEKSAKKLVANFKRLAAESKDSKLIKEAKNLEKKIAAQTDALTSATTELSKKEKEKARLVKELEDQETETMFARAVLGSETKELLSIQHHIFRHAAQHISTFTDQLSDAIEQGAPKEKLLKITNKISLENKKIITLSRFVTKARFDTQTNKINAELITFINEYVLNVYAEYKHLAMNSQNLKIKVENKENLKSVKTFKPIELIIILDNLLNNAFKAKAKKVDLVWKSGGEDFIELHLIDDGKGIPDKNLSKIFEFRFSTTNGSGLGLYHTKEIIEKMGGKIEVNNKTKKGTEFILKFKK